MTVEISPEMMQGPIPGMSLTSEPGAYPWENPSQLTTVEEAVNYYSERILDMDAEDSLLEALDSGVSIEKMAEGLTVSAAMNGIHNLDVAILINPYVRELMRYVADIGGIEYIDSYSELEKKDKVPYRLLRKVVKETFEEDLIPTMEAPTALPPPTGLMARPVETPELPAPEGELPPEETV
jgi:hypothetical protein